MRPLLYLSFRQVINGIRRAFSSARRVIGLIFFVAYYFLFLLRPMSDNGKLSSRIGEGVKIDQHLPIKPLLLLSAVLFAGFFLVTLLQMVSAVYYKGGFRRADVDTLFPTPLDRRMVLGMRILRDSLASVIFPILFTLIFLRPAVTGFNSFVSSIPDPNAARYAFRVGFLAFTLHGFAWVGIGYALSLWAGRPGDVGNARRRWYMWAACLTIAATLGYAGWAMRGDFSFGTFASITHNPIVRFIYFPATLACEGTMAAIYGSWGLVALYFSGLVVIGATGIWLALRQADWAYEIAASTTTATQETVEMQRKGDFYGIVAQQARLGKIKTNKVHWAMRKTMPREWALVWKEFIHTTRAGLVLNFMPLVIGLFLTVMLAILPDKKERVHELFLLMGVGMTAFVGASILQTGFVELLRRGDLVKPFPFTPARVIYFETLGHALPVLASIFIVALVAIVIKPAMWAVGLATMIGGPLFCLALTSVMMMTMLFFPDFDDPTQRGFRGLMQLLGMVVLLAPGIGAFAGVVMLKGGMVWAILAMAGLNAIVAGICSMVSGQLYANFNPSE